MNRTPIEWVKNPDGSQGYTLNHKTGCLNRTPEGLCLGGLFPCYAYKLANGRLKKRYLFNMNSAPEPEGYNDYWGDDPFYPRRWPEKLEQIRQRKKPAGIFLDDMSDWMGDYWPQEWTEAELQVMRDCPQHRFYTLTKQPQNLVKFWPYPPNCWVGVTATDPDKAWEATVWLQRIQAHIKYLSIEPLLRDARYGGYLWREVIFSLVDWVIIGAQTKPTVYPKLEWIEEIIEACNRAGIPVFLKNNLKPFLDKLPTRIVYQYGSGKLRQEVPA